MKPDGTDPIWRLRFHQLPPAPLNPRILSALDGIVALLHHTGIETVMITGKQSAATQAIGLQLV